MKQLHREIVMNCHYQGFNPVLFGWEKCQPCHSYGPAVRSYWLLHYIRSGKGHFLCKNQRYDLQKGEIFVISPYEETYYEADREDPWDYCWIGFTFEGRIPDCFHPPVLKCGEAGPIFEEMRSCKRKEQGKSAFLSAKLWELTSALLEKENHPRNYVEQALHCMHSEYMNDLRIAEIAARLNLDRSYFSNLFHAEMGIAPGEYLRTIRLEKAAELMRDYKMSPSTAGISTGYPDLYHFSKAFKNHFGVSPRKWCRELT